MFGIPMLFFSRFPIAYPMVEFVVTFLGSAHYPYDAVVADK